MNEVVYVDYGGTPEARFHAVGEPALNKPRITRCGRWVSLQMLEMQRAWAEKTATPCPECYPPVTG